MMIIINICPDDNQFWHCLIQLISIRTRFANIFWLMENNIYDDMECERIYQTWCRSFYLYSIFICVCGMCSILYKHIYIYPLTHSNTEYGGSLCWISWSFLSEYSSLIFMLFSNLSNTDICCFKFLENNFSKVSSELN